MSVLNLNNANKLYYGNTEAQKLYKGNQQLYPLISTSSLHWRFDYDYALTEIQFSFIDAPTTPIQLNTVTVTTQRLGTPFSTSNIASFSTANLIDGNLTTGLNGSTTNQNHAWKFSFATPKEVTSVWLAPRYSSATAISTVPTYGKLFNSMDGVSWNLVKEWVVSTVTGTIISPYNGTTLRPNILVQFEV